MRMFVSINTRIKYQPLFNFNPTHEQIINVILRLNIQLLLSLNQIMPILSLLNHYDKGRFGDWIPSRRTE